MGVGGLFASATMYFVQFDLLQGIDSFRQIKWLAIFALAFAVASAIFFIWEFISKKASNPPLSRLLSPAGRRKFWVELGIGIVLAVMLILRRKFW